MTKRPIRVLLVDDDYLVKPFTPRLLLAKLNAVLRRFERFSAELGAAAGPLVSRSAV